jgi:branched-chain amino acid transport system substrate-binding protein
VCREAQVCTDASADVKKHAAENGFNLVYEGQGSIAQPDFTAECLAARNAGVEVLAPVFDVNSIKRLVRSCSQQGYRPEWIIISGDTSLLAVPELNGSVTAARAVPYALDVPANHQYHVAFKQYAPGSALGGTQAEGWAAAKLFEKVLTNAAEPITSASILDSLWSLRGETLDGLVSPLTYARNQPAPSPKCVFAMVQKDGQFTAPDGTSPTCQP